MDCVVSGSTPRLTISVVVDNDSWIVSFALRLVDAIRNQGHLAYFCRSYAEIKQGDFAFFLGCVGIASPQMLARNRRNLVVHESDLPRGRGFSPLTWSILAKENVIPVCLIEAVEEADAGPIIYREELVFAGHELIDEMRSAVGEITVKLCNRFVRARPEPRGTPQQGQPTLYRRRNPKDSVLDPEKSIAEQFELLRVVDNERYPAFFDLREHRYVIRIEKMRP
jgi:methionyl-tRNA formyltransferase